VKAPGPFQSRPTWLCRSGVRSPCVARAVARSASGVRSQTPSSGVVPANDDSRASRSSRSARRTRDVRPEPGALDPQARRGGRRVQPTVGRGADLRGVGRGDGRRDDQRRVRPYPSGQRPDEFVVLVAGERPRHAERPAGPAGERVVQRRRRRAVARVDPVGRPSGAKVESSYLNPRRRVYVKRRERRVTRRAVRRLKRLCKEFLRR
jgi:hypothetical protein